MRRLICLFLLSAAAFWVACDPPPSPERPQGEPPEEGTAEPAAEASAISAETAEWRTDYGKAIQLASEQDKPVLVNFTGSDWCPPCMMLKRDVFEEAAFKNFAAQNLVLLEVDFPQRTELPEELTQQNEMLQQRFRIEGFPTLVVLDPEGKEQKRHVGYMPGGPSKLISWVKE